MDRVADHRIAGVEDASMEWSMQVSVNQISLNGCNVSFSSVDARAEFNLLKSTNHLDFRDFFSKSDVLMPFFHGKRSWISHK